MSTSNIVPFPDSSALTTADFLRMRANPPKPKLRAGLVYHCDDGRLICVECAGYTAKYTGRDRSGRRVLPNSQADADAWMRIMGKPLACESGCTMNPPTAGVTFDPAAHAAMLRGEL